MALCATCVGAVAILLSSAPLGQAGLQKELDIIHEDGILAQAAANAPDDAVAGVVLINCAGGMNNKVRYRRSAFIDHPTYPAQLGCSA